MRQLPLLRLFVIVLFLGFYQLLIGQSTPSLSNNESSKKLEILVNKGLPDDINLITFNKTKNILALQSDLGSLQVWDLALNSQIYSSQIAGAIDITLSADGKFIAGLIITEKKVSDDGLAAVYGTSVQMQPGYAYTLKDNKELWLQKLLIQIESVEEGKSIKTIDLSEILYRYGYHARVADDLHIVSNQAQLFYDEKLPHILHYKDLVCEVTYDLSTNDYNIKYAPWHSSLPPKEVKGNEMDTIKNYLPGHEDYKFPNFYEFFNPKKTKYFYNEPDSIYAAHYSPNGKFTVIIKEFFNKNKVPYVSSPALKKNKVKWFVPQREFWKNLENLQIHSLSNSGRYIVYSKFPRQKLKKLKIKGFTDLITKSETNKKELAKIKGKIYIFDLKKYVILNEQNPIILPGKQMLNDPKISFDPYEHKIAILSTNADYFEFGSTTFERLNFSGFKDQRVLNNNLLSIYDIRSGKELENISYQGGDIRGIFPDGNSDNFWIHESAQIRKYVANRKTIMTPFSESPKAIHHLQLEGPILSIASSSDYRKINLATFQQELYQRYPISTISKPLKNGEDLVLAIDNQLAIKNIFSGELKILNEHEHPISSIIETDNQIYSIGTKQQFDNKSLGQLLQTDIKGNSRSDFSWTSSYVLDGPDFLTKGLKYYSNYRKEPRVVTDIQANGMAISPDGNILAINFLSKFEGLEQAFQELDILFSQQLDKGNPLSLHHKKLQFRELIRKMEQIIIPGELILFKKNEEGEWDQHLSLEASYLDFTNSPSRSLSFSSDGQYLAASTQLGVKIWNVTTGSLIKEIRMDPQSGYQVNEDSLLLNQRKAEPFILPSIDPDLQVFTSGMKGLKLGFFDDKFSSLVSNIFFAQENNLLHFSIHSSPILQLFSGSPLNENKRISRDYLGSASRITGGTIGNIEGVNFVVNGNSKGEILIWKISSSEPALRIILEKENDGWVIITPEGYYYASKNSLSSIVFKSENKFYTFDQFDRVYNRPDLVLAYIQELFNFENFDSELLVSYQDLYQKRTINQANTNESFNIPLVNILNKNSLLNRLSRDRVVQIGFSSQTTTLSKINAWCNHVPILGIEGIPLTSEDIEKGLKSVPIILSEGENKIQFSAIDINGQESLKETIILEYYPPKEAIKKPNLYLIAICTDEYTDDFDPLSYTVKDGRDMVGLLSQQTKQYEQIFIDTLYNREVTSSNIENIKNRLKTVNVDDKVILFLSSHGSLDDSLNYYLHTSFSTAANIQQKSIAMSQLNNLLDRCPARKKLVLIDACESGDVADISFTTPNIEIKEEANDTSNTKGGVPKVTYDANQTQLFMREVFADLRNGTGATILSATSAFADAREDRDLKNGVFTHALLKSLTKESKKTDLNQDNFITISEWRNAAFQEVQRSTKGEQRSTTRQENPTLDFVIWNY